MSEMPTREVWIIKYVCSKGIRRAVLPVDPAGRPKLGYWGMTSGEYTDYEVVARREAEKIRVRKIASLRKQLARLEAIDFMTAPIKEWKP